MIRHRIGLLAELWESDLVSARAGDTPVLVIKIAGEVHAYEDRCPHLGLALSEGTLDGCVLTCAAHHWQYDVTTGRGINPATACMKRFPVAIEHGVVYVELPP